MSERDDTSRRDGGSGGAGGRDDASARDEIGSWLLGELSEQERARFEDRLARDPALRAEAERLGAVVARLEAIDDAVWAAQAVPGAATDGAAASDAAGSGASAASAGAGARRALPSPKRSGLGRRWFPAAPLGGGAVALACAALLAVGVGAGVLIGDRTADGGGAPTATVAAPAVVLAPLGSAPAGASAAARMDGPNRMVLSVRDLPPPPAGHYYEAWLLDGPGEMVPVAAFSVGSDGRAVVALPLPATAADYRYLDVSLQRVADGPEHSSDSVLRGRI